MTKNKKSFNLILFILAIALGIFLGIILLQKRLNDKTTVDLIQYDTAYNEIVAKSNNNIFKAKLNNKDVVINSKDKIIDENPESGTINLLYNDYYTITYGGITYLKKNNEVISSTNVKDYYGLIEEDGKYINIYYAYTINDYSEEYKISYNNLKKDTFLYNALNGEIIIKKAKAISPVLMGNEFKYFYIEYEQNNALFDIKNGEIVDLKKLKLVSDEYRMNHQDYKFYSSTYLIIQDGNNKKGLMDLNQNIIIPPMYNDLYFKENNPNLIAAINDTGKYGIINSQNITKLEFNYDGIIIKNNYILLLKDNRIGVLDKSLNTINEFLVPYNNDPFIIRENNDTKNSFEYRFKNGNIIISSNVLNDYNTYIIGSLGTINVMLGEKPQIIYNNEIDTFYIVTENYENDILNLKVYDASGNYISVYSKNVAKNIRNAKTELINKNTIKVNYYDQNNNYLSSEIINAATGAKIANDNDNKYNKVTKINDIYYTSVAGTINLFNLNDKLLESLSGEELKHLKDTKYAIKKDTYWYLIDIR